jgi:hypothetical protein
MKRIVVCVLLLAACRDNRPPTPTTEQSAQLNEAEDMLNGMAQNMAQNEQPPADRSASPSNQSE